MDPAAGTDHAVGVAYGDLVHDVSEGDTLLLNDGQIVLKVEQIRGSYNVDVIDWDSYYRKSICKTASLFRAACESAGVLNGLPEEQVQALATFGKNFGIAFQIVDDLLDYTSSEAEMGKPVLDDLRNGILSNGTSGDVNNIDFKNRRPSAKPFERMRQVAQRVAFRRYLLSRVSDSRPKAQHWFELAGDDAPPVFAFAGIWRPWRGTRKGETGEHRLFSFLTCDSNEIVRPIHAKAMPVVLADREEWDVWLTGSTEEALELQRPCPAHSLMIKPA